MRDNKRFNFGLTDDEVREFMKAKGFKTRDEFINFSNHGVTVDTFCGKRPTIIEKRITIDRNGNEHVQLIKAK